MTNKRIMIVLKTVSALILLAFWACNNSTAQQNKPVLKQKEKVTDNTVKTISTNHDKFQIDTDAILTNKNLQSLITGLEQANLVNTKTKSEIPSFIKTFLNSLTIDNFSIANPGESWQATCAIGMEKLPSRQLIYFGLGKDISLLTYYTGGFSKSGHILIIKFKDKKVIDFWSGNAFKNVSNKSEILRCIKENKDKKWGLNTNAIHI